MNEELAALFSALFARTPESEAFAETVKGGPGMLETLSPDVAGLGGLLTAITKGGAKGVAGPIGALPSARGLFGKLGRAFMGEPGPAVQEALLLDQVRRGRVLNKLEDNVSVVREVVGDAFSENPEKTLEILNSQLNAFSNAGAGPIVDAANRFINATSKTEMKEALETFVNIRYHQPHSRSEAFLFGPHRR